MDKTLRTAQLDFCFILSSCANFGILRVLLCIFPKQKQILNLINFLQELSAGMYWVMVLAVDTFECIKGETHYSTTVLTLSQASILRMSDSSGKYWTSKGEHRGTSLKSNW